MAGPPDPLPGMPVRYGDPGLYVCSIPDGGDPPDVKESTPALHVPAVRAIWLVLALCGRCNARTGRYCTAHNLSFLHR